MQMCALILEWQLQSFLLVTMYIAVLCDFWYETATFFGFTW